MYVGLYMPPIDSWSY